MGQDDLQLVDVSGERDDKLRDRVSGCMSNFRVEVLGGDKQTG